MKKIRIDTDQEDKIDGLIPYNLILVKELECYVNFIIDGDQQSVRIPLEEEKNMENFWVMANQRQPHEIDWKSVNRIANARILIKKD